MRRENLQGLQSGSGLRSALRSKGKTHPRVRVGFAVLDLVERGGFEPPSSRLQGGCSPSELPPQA